MTPSPRGSARPVFAAAFLFAIASSGGFQVSSPQPFAFVHTQSSVEELRTLEAEVAEAERRLELAKSDAFYLALEPSGELVLMHGGAVLQSYPVAKVEIGTPRIGFMKAGSVPDWRARIWTNGTLTPDRPIHDAVEDDATLADPRAELDVAVIPPTAEEAIPVPRRYRIRFDEGLSLEIVSEAAEDSRSPWRRGWRRLQRRWEDVGSALASSDRDAVRVRLTLEDRAAASLFRSLPPRSSFLVRLVH